MANYYEILGVARTATDKEIKKAYKALVKKYHPDLNRDNPAAEEKMKEVNEAYSVLSNEVSRIDYNKKLEKQGEGVGEKKQQERTRTRAAGQQQRRAGASANQGIDFNNLNERFASFFGFDPKTKVVTNEEKLNTYTQERRRKNPLDTTEIFDKFMGIK